MSQCGVAQHPRTGKNHFNENSRLISIYAELQRSNSLLTVVVLMVIFLLVHFFAVLCHTFLASSFTRDKGNSLQFSTLIGTKFL